MGKFVLKDCAIFAGGANITGDSNTVALDAGKDEVENTTFGNTTRTFQADALRTIGMSAEGYTNYGNSESEIYGQFDANIPVAVIPEGSTEGNTTYFFNAVQGSFNPVSGSIGEMASFTLDAMAANRLARGNLLAYVLNATASGSTTGQQLGAVSATQEVVVTLHVFNLAGASPTIDVVVQSDDNSGFTSAVNQITFAQVTTATSYEFTTTAGAITDDWWRVDYTMGGTVTDCDFAVTFAIQEA